MTLYPPALVRKAFANLCQTEGARRDAITSAYRADGSSLSLNWHAGRWVALDYANSRGTEVFASFIGPMATRPH